MKNERKEELKDEMKNRISLALKDPILQQGFEIICKENAELKNRDCWKSCEYANPKAELIGQHIKDVQNLTKAKEIIKEILEEDNYALMLPKEMRLRAEQFLNSEGEK